MKVIFAEKPSQARDYAQALGIKSKHDGYIKVKDSDVIQDAVITWGFGHLVSLKLPKEYKSPINTWKIENLPFKPEKFEFKIDKDKHKQFKIVKELFKDADTLINATDIDREGSNIFYSTLQQTGIKKKEIQRLWINSLVSSEIIKGFKNLNNNSKDYMMYQEAYARQISDYLIGMNLSPLYSILFQKQGYKDIFSIGRVQTPTLYLIYERQLEIESFKPEKFYEVIGEFKAHNGNYKGKAKIKTKDAKDIFLLEEKHHLSESKQGTITHLETIQKNQKSPKLHSLSTLQSSINKKYKYSPEKTKKIVQVLYERKILSYPRTDSNLITEEEFKYLKTHLEELKKIYNYGFKTKEDYLSSRKKYVDDSKVQEHHAIIPTSKVPNKEVVENLKEDEKNVLNEVISTTLSMFCEDHIYNETKVETDVNGLIFYSSGKQIVENGWKELFNINKQKKQENDDKEEHLPQLEKKENVHANIKTQEGTTTQPPNYTEGQLIPLMKTCGKNLDDSENSEILKDIQGLGTEATRDSIIKTLKDRNYIIINKNKVYITDKGRLLCESIKGSLLSSATMTAEWEKRLALIGQGAATIDSFIENTRKFIIKELQEHNQKSENTNIQVQVDKLNQTSQIGKCPNCNNGTLTDKGKVIKCNECEQIFFKNFFKKKLSDKQLKVLITNGKTSQKLKFKSKAGKPYEAYLKLEDDKEKGIKRIGLSFN